jgi:hypothetical protein
MMDNMKTEPCPSWETWCAYVDNRLDVSEQTKVKNHLKQCDRCFSVVVSIRQAVENPVESRELSQTPIALLQQAGQTGQKTAPFPRWMLYTAAAVLLLGLGLYPMYQTYLKSSSETEMGQLAFLDAEVRARQAIWPDLASDRVRGSSSQGVFGLSDADKASVQLGAALVQLTAELDYVHNRSNAQYQLRVIQFARNQFPADQGLDRFVKSFETDLDNPDKQPNVSQLQQHLTDFMVNQHAEREVYFRLGQWLQTMKIATQIAANLNMPVNTLIVSEQNHQTIQLFESISPVLFAELKALLLMIEQAESPQVILEQTSKLLEELILL